MHYTMMSEQKRHERSFRYGCKNVRRENCNFPGPECDPMDQAYAMPVPGKQDGESRERTGPSGL